jgi:iron complex transport system ATP-binding protein
MTPILKAVRLRTEGRLEETDIIIGKCELVAVIGANGSGKTSLLRTIADIDGEADLLEVAGEALTNVPPSRRPVLMTFLPASRDMVWPISVADVVGLGLASPDARRVEQLIELLELQHFRDRPINSLSTGERTRVLLARALAPAPKLLLLDEPLSNLDPYWSLRIIEILRSVVASTACSALVALHDLHLLDRFDRVLLIEKGRIVMDDSPPRILGSTELKNSFGVEQRDGRWEIRPTADPRSSP